MHKRKICVFTGTRADYGLLYWLMKEIQNDDDLLLQTLVTGMHFSPEFGLTYKKIIEDGFPITEKVEILLSGDTPSAITKSLGLATIGFADALDRLQPDIIVILGDRFEALAAAQSAMVAGIPVAHIHGGEITEGAIDDSIRHAITKMSALHFVCAQPYRQRVIQMGENPELCLNFGSPGLDYINRVPLLEKSDLSVVLQCEFKTFNYLITYHPETIKQTNPELTISRILKALDRLTETNLFFTAANADTNGRIINQIIENYVSNNTDKTRYVKNLGQINYLSLVKNVDAVIGNSSSGIIEAPLLKTPTINIGKRQAGRLKAESIIDIEDKEEAILSAIDFIKSSSFRSKIAEVKSLYGKGETSTKIKNTLKSINIENLTSKKFFDHDIGA